MKRRQWTDSQASYPQHATKSMDGDCDPLSVTVSTFGTSQGRPYRFKPTRSTYSHGMNYVLRDTGPSNPP